MAILLKHASLQHSKFLVSVCLLHLQRVQILGHFIEHTHALLLYSLNGKAPFDIGRWNRAKPRIAGAVEQSLDLLRMPQDSFQLRLQELAPVNHLLMTRAEVILV